ncbi:MAG: YbbR-like domain-containing protein [Clostridiaceae bacterium]
MAKKHEALVKVCCVVAAFCLWLYISNKENPSMEYKIKNIPVTLINVDSMQDVNLSLVPNQELTATITVQGTASNVYSTKKEDFALVADVSEYALKSGSLRMQLIVKDSPNNVTIINPESLYVDVYMEKYIEKQVPVSINLLSKSQSGYEDFKPSANPDSVIVSGPESYVSKVDGVIADVEISNYDKDFSNTVPLKPVDKNGNELDTSIVKVNPGYITVDIAINKIQQSNVVVKTKGELANNLKMISITPEEESLNYYSKASDDVILTNIETEELDLSSITESIDVELNLIVPDNIIIEGEKQTVKVKVKVDKLTNKEIELPIKVKNEDQYTSYSLVDARKSITISGYESQINSLDDSSLELVMDLENVEGEGEIEVPLQVLNLPDGVSVLGEDDLTGIINLTK